VVGNVDKTFLDYIIIAKAKWPTTAFCAFSRPKISIVVFFLFLITFFLEVQYEYSRALYKVGGGFGRCGSLVGGVLGW
jgi:hypothetical protein